MLNVKVTNRMSHEDYVAVYSDYPYALSRRHLLGICSTIVVCLVLILPTPGVWLGDQESGEPQLSQGSLDYLAHDQSATEKAFAEEEHVSLPHQENYDDYDIPSAQFANTDNLDDMTSSAEAELGGAYDYPDAITDSDIASSDWTMPPLDDTLDSTLPEGTDGTTDGTTTDSDGMLAQSSEQDQTLEPAQGDDTLTASTPVDTTDATTATVPTTPTDAATSDSTSSADEKLLAEQAAETDAAAQAETTSETTVAQTSPETTPADGSSDTTLVQSTTEQASSEGTLASTSTGTSDSDSKTTTGVAATGEATAGEAATGDAASGDAMLAQSTSDSGAASTATTDSETAAEAAGSETTPASEQQLAAAATDEAASSTASTSTEQAATSTTSEKEPTQDQLLASAATTQADSGKATTDTSASGTGGEGSATTGTTTTGTTDGTTAESMTASTTPDAKETTPAAGGETQLAAADEKKDGTTAEAVSASASATAAAAAAGAAADSKADGKEQLAKAQPATPAVPEGKWFRYTIAKGDNLSVIFKNLDLPYATLNRITKVAGRKDIALDVGEPIYFMIDKDNIVLQVVNTLDKDKQVRFARNNGEEDFKVHREDINSHVADPKLLTSIPDAYTMPLAAKALQERKDLEAKREKALADRRAYEKANNINPTRPRLLIGSIEQGENFSRAARREGLTPTEIKTIAKLLQKKINVNKLKSGDNFRVLFTGIGTQSDICAISFTGSQGNYEIFLNPKDRNFYGENEYTPTAGVFKRFPLAGDFKVTSHFNPQRRHPVTRRVSPHNGVDFKAKVGTPVYAPADGVVTFSGYQRAAGYYVIVRHANNYSTVYMHLSKSEVKKGAKVVVGQMIARTGNTGRTTGPHLHYEIRINDRPVNPLKVELPSTSHPNLVREQREAFANNVKVLKADLQNNSLAATR